MASVNVMRIKMLLLNMLAHVCQVQNYTFPIQTKLRTCAIYKRGDIFFAIKINTDILRCNTYTHFETYL